MCSKLLLAGISLSCATLTSTHKTDTINPSSHRSSRTSHAVSDTIDTRHKNKLIWINKNASPILLLLLRCTIQQERNVTP